MIADALHKKVLCRWKPLQAAKRDLAHFLRALEARAIALEAWTLAVESLSGGS